MARPRASFLARLTQSPARSMPTLVADNLGHVLNTRKGCGSVIPELGLGDYEAEPNTHEATLALEREVRALVLRYEPRLREPQVTLRGRHGYRAVHFSLIGLIGGESRAYEIVIDTSTRHVDVWPLDLP